MVWTLPCHLSSFYKLS
ncbi:unnamed protein product [Linum tenue]|uniref:Uncharacterized protein n=1 Tax=Linum tenue TaxID=586396 RepID=A0AAV0IS62_9ROSI|nr:unnamed protein product [Linum tenue]